MQSFIENEMQKSLWSIVQRDHKAGLFMLATVVYHNYHACSLEGQCGSSFEASFYLRPLIRSGSGVPLAMASILSGTSVA